MTDTHTHLYLPEFNIEGQAEGSMAGQCAAVDRAVAAGVTRLVFPNIDRSSIEPMQKLHELRPDNTYIAMGLHPTEVRDDWRTELNYILDRMRCQQPGYVAVGEIGIDLYWDRTYEQQQMVVFAEQLAVAREFGVPVLIHCREGLAQTLEVLQDFPEVKAVFHSFGGSTNDVELIRRQGDYMFGINGIVTFKNSKLASVLPAIGLNRILTETDSPFLAPVPHRGSRNESAWIPCIVDRIAESFGVSPDEVAETTDRNATEFFNIKH